MTTLTNHLSDAELRDLINKAERDGVAMRLRAGMRLLTSGVEATMGVGDGFDPQGPRNTMSLVRRCDAVLADPKPRIYPAGQRMTGVVVVSFGFTPPVDMTLGNIAATVESALAELDAGPDSDHPPTLDFGMSEPIVHAWPETLMLADALRDMKRRTR